MGAPHPQNVLFETHLLASARDARLCEDSYPKSPSCDSRRRELVQTGGFQHMTGESANTRR